MNDTARNLKCRACALFVPDPKTANVGECHRKSPEPNGNKPAPWPTVSVDGWCGEWRKRTRQSQ